ncbi:hypothetical protein QUF75_08975 [Desulfococcaceae bacterium HSG7]|nr:hypothetical protein [Desulfococcaceae bacterium HSG7]
MTDIKYKEDYDFAKRICAALRNGPKEQFEEVYNRFHLQFLSFSNKRLYCYGDCGCAESVVSEYWIELLDGRYICKYQGKGPLEKYLRWRLNDRIKNKIGRKEPEPPPPEIDPVEQIRQKILYAALLEFKKEFPRDAYYIAMYLEGMTYEEMARNELACENPDEEAVRKKTDAIKVQFTRKKTGSLVRYKKILERKMDEHGIDKSDLLS